MRIIRLAVRRLLDTFDYDIQLKLKDHITILHGLNGYGKTTLLQMVDALFNARYSQLRKIPFSVFQLDFDDTSVLSVRHNPLPHEHQSHKQKHSIQIAYTLSGRSETFEPPELSPSEMGVSIQYFENIPGLARMDTNEWRYIPTNESLSFSEVIDRFAGHLPRGAIPARKSPAWLSTILESIKVSFIGTQRLLTNTPPAMWHHRYDASSQYLRPSISVYSEELAYRIEQQLGEYATLCSSLDRTYPIRLLKRDDIPPLDSEIIRRRLTELEKKRARLQAAGLLPKEESGAEIPASVEIPASSIDPGTNRVLSVYLRDSEQKLGVFDKLAEKIELFKKVINDHFRFKEMVISRKNGIGFFATRHVREELSLTSLSSGEQHEVVLLYELLFRIGKNSLILIDEPEISLHIAWQEEFLQDLEKIISMSSFDVLIATHSPQIVSTRWDLTVRLEEPTEIKK
jgi:predicted ATPase